MSAATAAAQASTGPRTAEGKSISALNSLTHGLTARSPLLPSESPIEYQDFQSAVFERYEAGSLEDIAILDEYTDISWRLRRVPVHEARLITLELKRMQIERKENKTLAELLDGLDDISLEAVAYERLLKSHTLTNLHRQEARLTRRLTQLKPDLDRMMKVQARRRAVAAQRIRIEAAAGVDPSQDISDPDQPHWRSPKHPAGPRTILKA
jgi:hypothetical protein